MNDDGLITVEFTDDFPPFDKHKGDTRKVSKNAAYKLYNHYGVIKNPFNNDKRYRDRLSTVVVINPKMLRVYGHEWYPYSEHDVDPSMVQHYIDDGSLKLKSDIANEQNVSVGDPVPPNIAYEILDRIPHMNHVHLPGETRNWYPESPIVQEWYNTGKIRPVD